MNKEQKERYISRLKKRYGERELHHLFDCQIYNIHLELCTCGLYDDLKCVEGSGIIEELYPQLWKEKTKEGFIKMLLRTYEEGDLFEICRKCEGKGTVEDKIWGECKGSGFTRVKELQPISEEEWRKKMIEAG